MVPMLHVLCLPCHWHIRESTIVQLSSTTPPQLPPTSTEDGNSTYSEPAAEQIAWLTAKPYYNDKHKIWNTALREIAPNSHIVASPFETDFETAFESPLTLDRCELFKPLSCGL
jgi:hypothetical protein